MDPITFEDLSTRQPVTIDAADVTPVQVTHTYASGKTTTAYEAEAVDANGHKLRKFITKALFDQLSAQPAPSPTPAS